MAIVPIQPKGPMHPDWFAQLQNRKGTVSVTAEGDVDFLVDDIVQYVPKSCCGTVPQRQILTPDQAGQRELVPIRNSSKDLSRGLLDTYEAFYDRLDNTYDIFAGADRQSSVGGLLHPAPYAAHTFDPIRSSCNGVIRNRAYSEMQSITEQFSELDAKLKETDRYFKNLNENFKEKCAGNQDADDYLKSQLTNFSLYDREFKIANKNLVKLANKIGFLISILGKEANADRIAKYKTLYLEARRLKTEQEMLKESYASHYNSVFSKAKSLISGQASTAYSENSGWFRTFTFGSIQGLVLQGLIASFSNINLSSITNLVTATTAGIPWLTVSFCAIPIITGALNLLLKKRINKSYDPDLLALKGKTTVQAQQRALGAEDTLRQEALGGLLQAKHNQVQFEATPTYSHVKPSLVSAQKNIKDAIHEYTGIFSGKKIPEEKQKELWRNINLALCEPISRHLGAVFNGGMFEGRALANGRLNGGQRYTKDALFSEQERREKYPNLQRILAREIRPFLKFINDKEEERELYEAETRMNQENFESFLK